MSRRMQEYLPVDEMEEGRFPDREFFWGVALTTCPNWANLYIEKVIKARHAEDPHRFDNAKTINVSAGWLAKLQ